MFTRWISVLLFALVGCASTSLNTALDEVRPGMDKDEVLEKVGNPKRTFRESSQDHWIYVYHHHDQQWMRVVLFENGRVSKVNKPIAREVWMKDLENAKTLEEYEQKAREHQKKSGQFQNIDGGSGDPSKE